MTDERGELRVGAHVLVQLGSELVTDVEQALLECVKNAYDADSPGCRIIIETEAEGSLSETAPAANLLPFNAPAENVAVRFQTEDGRQLRKDHPGDGLVCRTLEYRGRICIEDAGGGIPFESLSKSWLVISASLKRGDEGRPKKKTALGRTPLGDKGLGRLGTMKLGDILLVESATSASAEVSSAWFRWADCEQARTVDEIPVKLSRSPNTEGLKGTRVSVLGIRDLQEWKRKDRLSEITRSMARLISPFEAATTFPVTVQLDAGEQSLALVTEEVLSRAMADFHFRWEIVDGKPALYVRARLRRRLLTSQRTKALRERTARVFSKDGGKAFAAYLKNSRRMKGYDKAKIDVEGAWFTEIEHRFEGIQLLAKQEHLTENPGPFSGAFYYFHFVGDGDDTSASATGTGTSLQAVRDLSGISILRDGFQVRNRGDWLGLSSGMTSGSTYNLRPENTLGYFALSGERNYKLVEKSDREGFVDNAAYRGFLNIARTCRDFANDAIVAVRRSLDDYDKGLREKDEEKGKSSSGDLETVGSMAAAALEVGKLAAALGEELTHLGNAEGGDPAVQKRVADLADQIVQAASQTAKDGDAPEVLVDRIEREINDGRERSAALVESAAAGLASRGLMHELRAHLAEIRHRVTSLERGGGLGRDAIAHLTAIRRSCAAIAQAAAQVDPLIPRARELKTTFDVLETVTSYFDQRSGVFSSTEIDIDITGQNLKVRMNPARLLQTLDNLTRNSVFWLGKLPKGRKKRIEIEVSSAGVIFSDTGPGVDPIIEETLFDLFVTTRHHEEGGQGLGLFISSELLALEGCSIALAPERNKGGRKHRFVIDLSAVRQG